MISPIFNGEMATQPPGLRRLSYSAPVALF